MKIKLIVLTVFLLSAFAGVGQDKNFRKAPLEQNSNYFDIVANKTATLARLHEINDRKSKKKIKQFRRWASYYKDRVLSDGSFMPATHTYNEWKNENVRHTNNNQSNEEESWSLVGPITLPVSSVGFYPGMGRVNTVAFNGIDVNTLYVATPAGGVWKTTDGGVTWSAKSDNLPNLGVSDIVINPTDTKVLYLASGDFDGGQNRSVGVFKSTDSGDSWSITGLAFTLSENNIISKLLIDPSNVNTVFATTKNSIKRTTDGGVNWTDVHTESGAIFNDILYKIGSNAILYATSNKGKFYLSTNNGASWAVASTPASNYRVDIALTANDPALILTLDRLGTVRKSIDQGNSWTTISNIPSYESQYEYNQAIAISPMDKNLILAGGIEGWRSKDGGVTWEKYLDGYWTSGNPYFYVHSDHHDMMFVPNTNIAFSLNDGGIFKGDASIDTEWTDLSSGLAITQYYNVSGTPQTADKLIMGAQDNDIAVYNGSTFTGENAGSDGVEGLWDYTDSNIAWTCSQSGAMKRTLDGFASSQYVDTPAGDVPFVWELEIHPTNPQTIFGGFGDIYKSTDRGDNWTNLNSNVGSIEFISISPSDPKVIYVSGANNVAKTTDAGSTWEDITLPQQGIVKSIEIHPSNPAEVYLAYAGYEAGKIYKSVDSGVNWINITGSLPNIPTHKIIYKTGSTDGKLFLATDLGVYTRSNSSGDWTRFGNRFPNVIVYDLEINYPTKKLRVATYGRGVWEISISDEPDTQAPTLVSSTPADDATNVANNTHLTLVFDENITKSTGLITLKGGSTDISISVVSSEVTISGQTVTIDLSADLEYNTDYHLLVAGDVFKDYSDNHYSGILDATSLNFKTVVPPDTQAPTIISTTPADGTTDVALDSNLIIVFDENIEIGAGAITLKGENKDIIIAVSSAEITINKKTVTINPTSDLENNNSYYVLVGEKAFKDKAGNYFVGIATSTWKFTSPVVLAEAKSPIKRDEIMVYSSNNSVEVTELDSSFKNVKIAIYDANGKVIMNQSFRPHGQSISVPLNLEQGVYVLFATSNNKISLKKFIVTK